MGEITLNLTVLNDYDCVIMLTFSDWFNEMYSNRFHYANRFAKQVKVYFVQVNGSSSEPKYLSTGNENIEVIQLDSPTNIQGLIKLFSKIKIEGYKRPLFWVYNPYFSEILNSLQAPRVVYHATEDYFCSDFVDDVYLRNCLINLINRSFLVVSVSQGVEESIKKNVPNVKNTIVADNGCDFSMWSRYREIPKERAIVYQGGIHSKIDFDMLDYIINDNPSVKFFFYGETVGDLGKWAEILSRPNVFYKGRLGINELIREVSSYKVGIIPFVQNDWIVNRSFPLKFFEYISAGLRVVSVPIRNLPSEHYIGAADYKAFSASIKKALDEEQSREALELQVLACKKADYNSKFNNVIEKINSIQDHDNNGRIYSLLVTDLKKKSDNKIIYDYSIESSIQFKIIGVETFLCLKPDNIYFIDILAISDCVLSERVKDKFFNLNFKGLKVLLNTKKVHQNEFYDLNLYLSPGNFRDIDNAIVNFMPLYSETGYITSLYQNLLSMKEEVRLVTRGKKFLIKAVKITLYGLSKVIKFDPDKAYLKIKSYLQNPKLLPKDWWS